MAKADEQMNMSVRSRSLTSYDTDTLDTLCKKYHITRARLVRTLIDIYDISDAPKKPPRRTLFVQISLAQRQKLDRICAAHNATDSIFVREQIQRLKLDEKFCKEFEKRLPKKRRGRKEQK